MMSEKTILAKIRILAIKGAHAMEVPIILLIVGFVAAVTLGSVAWYNSKRPPGWEDAEKPDVVPDLTPEQEKWPN
jgi:hypothetical protein